MITIFGSGFNGNISVGVGGKMGTVQNASSTSVETTLPAVGPGSYPLQLHVGDSGLADIRYAFLLIHSNRAGKYSVHLINTL